MYHIDPHCPDSLRPQRACGMDCCNGAASHVIRVFAARAVRALTHVVAADLSASSATRALTYSSIGSSIAVVST